MFGVALVLVLFAPFPLWLVEIFFPLPFVIEELFKFLIIRKFGNLSALEVMLLALLFSLSESVLYLVNFFALGNFSDLGKRLVLTTTMHVATWMLMYFGNQKGKNWRYLTLVVGGALHYGFNKLI